MANAIPQRGVKEASPQQRMVVGAILIIIALCFVVGGVLSGARWFSLAQWGTETSITITSIGDVENRVLDERDQSRRYAENYVVTYDVNGETKSYNWTHYSFDSQVDYTLGQMLPAVIDDLQNPTDLYAPTTRQELWLGNVLGKGMIVACGLLLAAAGVAVVARSSNAGSSRKM